MQQRINDLRHAAAVPNQVQTKEPSGPSKSPTSQEISRGLAKLEGDGWVHCCSPADLQRKMQRDPAPQKTGRRSLLPALWLHHVSGLTRRWLQELIRSVATNDGKIGLPKGGVVQPPFLPNLRLDADADCSRLCTIAETHRCTGHPLTAKGGGADR